MTTLSPRKQNILKAVIDEFIKTGKPVSSSYIYEKYNFGIKPAMIRNELLELSERGYLYQPHYSAGRIPTDLGYEFFVKSILEENKDIELTKSIVDLFCKMSWQEMAKKISETLDILGIVANIYEQSFVYKEGLKYLINDLEWQTKDEINQIIDDFENLENRLLKNYKILSGENFIKFFIGSKNFLTKSKLLATIVGDYKINNQKIFILVIGPKRMNYKKVCFALKGLKKYCNYGRN